MTDQTIPNVTPEDMEHARSYVQDFLDATYAPDRTLAVARVLQSLLPAPPTPTLAVIPPEDRAACRWMQADVAGHDTRYVIANPHDRHGEAALIAADGKIEWSLPEYVTPRPDLPRMEWPGDTPHKGPKVTFTMPAPTAPAPALPEGWRLADHPEHGRVIVTNPTPNRDGYVCYVLPADDYVLGYDWLLCKPYELTYLDQEADQ